MEPGTSADAEIHRAIGKLDAKAEMTSLSIQSLTQDMKQSSQENQRILQKLDKLESKIDPLPGAVARHDERIDKLESFDAKLMGVVALAGITMSAIGTGFWMLLTHFSDVVAFAKKILGG